MDKIILKSLKLGIWRQLDVQFAYMLVNHDLSQNSLILAIITLSFYVRRGNVCLPVSMLTPDQLFFGLHINLAREACKKAGNLSMNHWEKLLLSNLIVTNGSFLAPLVLDRKRLYLYRMWKNECLVTNFFYSSSQQIPIISESETHKISTLLNRFFPVMNNKQDVNKCIKNSRNINWQKVAIAMALVRKVIIISGGPGTGKTSIISILLIILSLLNDNVPLNIKMATPTGKSAARLNESVSSMIKKFNISSLFHGKQLFSIQAVTLHKLLGVYFKNKNIINVKNNFLFLDYLIIDESSMIDLSIMARLVTFLSSTTKVIFLGDHKQLPSVEPGSVFSDICYFNGQGYTFKFFEQLKSLTNYILPFNKRSRYDIVDSLCLLRRSYRFSVTSGIGKLACAVNSGNLQLVLSLLTSNSHNDLKYITLKNDTDYFNMLVTCAFGYINYFKNISYYKNKNLLSILNVFNRYRVLCALREGPFGVLQLNSLIENILIDQGYIQLVEGSQNYIGKPIIITANSHSSTLFNGEVGIVLSDGDGDSSKLFAYFLSSDNSVKKISLHNLPKHETSFVLTVHKAQGSEFENTVLILPDKIVPILSRELLYTGITRACKFLSIYATDPVINYSVNNQCKRYSGLVDRLQQLRDSWHIG